MLRSFGLAGMMTLALFSAPASALDINNNDHGGQIGNYMQRIAAAESRGEPIRIGAVECDSSCTLFLGSRHTCVSPQAVFGFHAPWVGAPNAGVVSPQLTAMFAHSYRPALRRMFISHVMASGGAVPGPLMKISGAQLASLGYRLCGEGVTREAAVNRGQRAARYYGDRRISPSALAASPENPFAPPWFR